MDIVKKFVRELKIHFGLDKTKKVCYNNYQNDNNYQKGDTVFHRYRFYEKFRGMGCRITLTRQAVLDILNRTPKHLSSEEVFVAVNKIYPGIGIATVYRTLDLLSRMGLIFKFEFGDGKSRYELAKSDKGHHHHLVCNGCGRIIDYSDFIDKEVKFVRELEEELAKKYKFKINSHQIHFYGLCEKCA